MGVEPGFLSEHAASTGTAFVQTSPNFQAVNGESVVKAGQLVSIDPLDGRAYLCDPESPRCIPAGFAATDHPQATTVDDTAKLTIVRQGRIKGFAGLIPGMLYYPSADVPGGIVPERGSAGPVVTSVTAVSGAGFLRNVHIREGHRPRPGVWTVSFPTATTCAVTPPGGIAGAPCTVASGASYNGTITGASDFFIETRTLTGGDEAAVTVSYTATGAAVLTLDSPGNAIASAALIAAGTPVGGAVKGLWTVTTTGNSATVAHNGGSASPAMTIAAGNVRPGIIPGLVLSFESETVTAETNYILVDSRRPLATVGIAIDETTLQVLMGGIG